MNAMDESPDPLQPNDPGLAQAKLHARLHDPAEKALVLLRDPAGHEGGTTRSLRAELFGASRPAAEVEAAIRKADHWASAADRPQFPRDPRDGRFARWSQVDFAAEPVLIHPLSGRQLDLRQLGGLRDVEIREVKAQSHAHFQGLIVPRDDGAVDGWRTLLTFWRFGPELGRTTDTAGLGALWRRLPADTRIPDHTIWDHLDLVSAFTGAFHADPADQAALLHVSLGPVQGFIAAARTSSDLWAGSHLLARLSWEAMRVLCERLGPDAILFPSLRGIPQVDLWLIESGLDPQWFREAEWYQRRNTDASSLFSAAIPNRFVAVVPQHAAEALAQRVTERVQAFARTQAESALEELVRVAGRPPEAARHAYQQIADQMAGFPEVSWSVVDYDALTAEDRAASDDPVLDPTRLTDALRQIAGTEATPGFLGERAWTVLKRPVEVTDPEDGRPATFYRPNPGVLYPAVYELGERALGASKTLHPFAPLTQHGYRCSLTGETEWLTEDPEPLTHPPGQRRDTLWAQAAENQPVVSRKGEHLGALATLKRFWPRLFCRELRETLPGDKTPDRFVVSTHTMALVPALRRFAENGQPLQGLAPAVAEAIDAAPPVALPRRLAQRFRDHPDWERLKRLPGWLEAQAERNEADGAARVVRDVLGERPETYYALVLLDGDGMGRWLGGDPELAVSYRAAFHPKLAAALDGRFRDNVALREYLDAPRAVSPGRHIAISNALNDFSGPIARWVVEECFDGRILYAGGDDVMAMLATPDVLGAAETLRLAYSGEPTTDTGDQGWLGGGFVRRAGQLHAVMGEKATASAGIVIAHHKTPLTAALNELRAAERRAKTDGGRDAFAISVLKRSGGALRHTARWRTPCPGAEDGTAGPSEMTVLRELADELRTNPAASRWAAYAVADWLAELPEPGALGGPAGMTAYLEAVLHASFERHGLEAHGMPRHARRLARLGPYHPADGSPLPRAAAVRARLADLVGIAEFFARDVRS
jgi:CRISPR-associated protein Cmr2